MTLSAAQRVGNRTALNTKSWTSRLLEREYVEGSLGICMFPKSLCDSDFLTVRAGESSGFHLWGKISHENWCAKCAGHLPKSNLSLFFYLLNYYSIAAKLRRSHFIEEPLPVISAAEFFCFLIPLYVDYNSLTLFFYKPLL